MSDETIEPVEKATVKNEPNVRWTAKKDEGEPPTEISIGMDVLHLPSAEVQRAGFYHKDAATLILIKNGYKAIKPKG